MPRDIQDALTHRRPQHGLCVDLLEAKEVELLTGPGGKTWVNVDGVCVLRVGSVDTVVVDTTNARSTDKVVT